MGVIPGIACQPEFLPLDHKEGRSLALRFCEVPGSVYEVTHYYSWKVKQLLNVTDRPIFPVLHGFHCAVDVALLERGKEKSFGFRLNCCNVVEHLVVKVSLNYFLGKWSYFQGACRFSVLLLHLPPLDFCLQPDSVSMHWNTSRGFPHAFILG